MGRPHLKFWGDRPPGSLSLHASYLKHIEVRSVGLVITEMYIHSLRSGAHSGVVVSVADNTNTEVGGSNFSQSRNLTRHSCYTCTHAHNNIWSGSYSLTV